MSVIFSGEVHHRVIPGPGEISPRTLDLLVNSIAINSAYTSKILVSSPQTKVAHFSDNYFPHISKKHLLRILGMILSSLHHLLPHVFLSLFSSLICSSTATWRGGGSSQAGGQQNRVWLAGVCLRPPTRLHHCKRADPWGETLQGRTSDIHYSLICLLLDNVVVYLSMGEKWFSFFLCYSFLLHDL